MSGLQPPEGGLPWSATAICLRDRPGGFEVLLVRRHDDSPSFSGQWTVPGGLFTPDEQAQGERGDMLGAAARAAARELQEETALALPPERFRPWSRWTTPPGRSKRFVTWFFIGRADGDEALEPDPREVAELGWFRPRDALLQLQLVGFGETPGAAMVTSPPLLVTLAQLDRAQSIDTLLAAATPAGLAARDHYTRHGRDDEGPVFLFHGDAGYDDTDPDRPGARHRMVRRGGCWTYDCSG